MSATELAIVVEGWATLTGLFVVIAGAVFAGLQLRQQSNSQRLTALMAVLQDVRSPRVGFAWYNIVSRLPDDFDFAQLTPEEREAVLTVGQSYERLGNLIANGLVDEEDVFQFVSLSQGPIRAWEKIKHTVRSEDQLGHIQAGMHFEYLAARAQRYLADRGLAQFGGLPVFDADMSVLSRVGMDLQRARPISA